MAGKKHLQLSGLFASGHSRTEKKSFTSRVLTILKWDKTGPVHHAAGGEMVFLPFFFLCQFLEYRQDCFPCNALIFHLCSFCAEDWHNMWPLHICLMVLPPREATCDLCRHCSALWNFIISFFSVEYVCSLYCRLLKTKFKRKNIHDYFRCMWHAKMRNYTISSLSVVTYVLSWSEGGISEWEGQSVTKPSKLLISGKSSPQTGLGPWTQALLHVFP